MMTIGTMLWALAAPADAQVRAEARMRTTGTSLVLGGTALGAAAVVSGVLVEQQARSSWDARTGQLYLTAPMAVSAVGLVTAGAVMHVRAGHVELAAMAAPTEDGGAVVVGGRF